MYVPIRRHATGEEEDKEEEDKEDEEDEKMPPQRRGRGILRTTEKEEEVKKTRAVVVPFAKTKSKKRGFGKIARAFPKSHKNKAKSLEFVLFEKERLVGKKKKSGGGKEEEEDGGGGGDGGGVKAERKGKETLLDDDDDDENDEKNYTLDLGELHRRVVENGRRNGGMTSSARVGYVSAKGRKGGGRNVNQTANLADLDLADEETVRQLLSSLPVSHYEERKKKTEDLILRYPEWFRYLTHDFSVLLYGFGSKKQVLEHFASNYLLDGAVVVVNGYQQRVSALSILNQCVFALSDESENLNSSSTIASTAAAAANNNNNNNKNNNNNNNENAVVANNAQALLRRIAELTVDHSGGGGRGAHANKEKTENDTMHNITNNTTTTMTTTIATKTRGRRRDKLGGGDALALCDNNTTTNERDQSTASFNDGGSASRLYLVVHNIDGVAMRNAETQSILGELSSFPRVHLIASVDHVNAPLLWSKREAAKFNWIYQKAVTFAPYAKETANDPQLLASKGEERHVRGAANVLKSLTRNARIIFRIIAEAQISENGQGLTFPQLFMASRESFLVTAELALRGVLTEFTDHELIRIKKVSDGGEDLITVPMDNAALEQLIEDECEEINNFF